MDTFRRTCTTIRKLTSDLDWGFKYTPVGARSSYPIHAIRNTVVIDFLNRKRQWLGQITNQSLQDHFDGKGTLYFAGATRADETLGMIDVDCHHRGTYAEAVRFIEDVAARWLPGLFSETSTHGQGTHGFPIIDKSGVSAHDYNHLWLDLGKALNEYAKAMGYGIEVAETKGTCPVVTWNQDGTVCTYTAGVLAKIPREVVGRWDEFQATTRLTVKQLADIIMDIRRATANVEGAPAPARPALKVHEEKQPRRGSVSGRCIKTELLPAYVAYAEELLNGRTLTTPTRHVATAQDLAMTMMIVLHCSTHMNSNGTLPRDRVKGLWDAVVEEREFTRTFSPARFAACRNLLSSLGWIDWTDPTYTPGHLEEGTWVRGRAAKWKFTAEAIELLQRIGEEKDLLEEKKEEKTSSSTQSEGTGRERRSFSTQNDPIVLNETTIKPVLVLTMPRLWDWRDDAERIDKLLASAA